MKERRQQILAGVLVAMLLYFGGESVWETQVRSRLNEQESRLAEMAEKLEKRTKLFRKTKKLKPKIQEWERQALSEDSETARSLYRHWLLTLIRDARLQNSRVDARSPRSRRGYRVLSVSASARGSLQQIVDALFAFENADLLHKIVSIRLVPRGSGGQFELSMEIEAIMMPGVKRDHLAPGRIQRTVSADRRAYDVIARDNIFGIAVDHRDPMQMTRLTGVTSRNGVLLAWITEEISDQVHRLPEGAEFDTAALRGRIVHIDQDRVTIETGGRRIQMAIGESFAQARIVPEAAGGG